MRPAKTQISLGIHPVLPESSLCAQWVANYSSFLHTDSKDFDQTDCCRFDGQTKNYKLYYDGLHYVGEKRFETVEQLVADGLIHFYLESRAADYIASLSDTSNYAQSPYLAYSVKKKRLQKSRRHAVNNTVVHRDLLLDKADAGAPPVSQFFHSFKVYFYHSLEIQQTTNW